MDPFGDDDDPFGEDPEWAFDSLDDGNEDGTPSTKPALYGAEHALILLDCNPSMFERYIQDENGQMLSPVELSLNAISKLLRMRIRAVAESKTGRRNGVGVLLYGCDTMRSIRGSGDTSDSDGAEEEKILPSTHELLELTPPGIEQVLGIQACLDKRDLGKEFSAGNREDRGDEEDGAQLLRTALHEANKVFVHAKCVKSESPSNKLPDAKALWIFTNCDNPCSTEGDAKQISAVAKDAMENGIDINLLPLPPKDKQFDRALFYDQVLSPSDYIEDLLEDGDVEAILDSFDRAIHKVRKYTVIPLLLPGWRDREDEATIMLDIYSRMQIKTKPSSVTVHQELNRATEKKSKMIEADTGSEVVPSRVHSYAEFCGGRVTIKKEDVSKLKSLCNSNDKPSLMIFGFKEMRTLSKTNLSHKPLLAFGNDILVQGSRKALFNLKQSMLKKGVYAVGEFVHRKTYSARLVALVPLQDSSGGFQIIPLPFKEELRSIQPDDIVTADKAAVEAANAMVSKCVIKTNGEPFSSILPENPYLGYFFNFLESVSLGGKLIKPEDEACMNEAMMLANVQKEMEEFTLSLPEDEAPKHDRKRKQPAKSTNKYNVNVSTDPLIPREWMEMYRNDEIADCTSTELKEFLRSIGERITGKKADLVDRIERAIQKQLARK